MNRKGSAPGMDSVDLRSWRLLTALPCHAVSKDMEKGIQTLQELAKARAWSRRSPSLTRRQEH
ncbi:MAG TPA: hypothetical protein ENN39_03095 [Desulfonatronum sp.]|nr:hypothetical protein [Desulfonatronum sp.]